MERERQSTRRVFLNNIDMYSSKYIAKFLCDPGVGASSDDTGDGEASEGELGMKLVIQLVGSLSDQPEGDRPHVLEEYSNLERVELLSKLMNCDVIIYNVDRYIEQVEEALWAVSALHREMESFVAPKMFILISTVLTWANTRPVNPEEPEIPFTDEMFCKRRPHPNFKRHIELEKKVVKMGKTNRSLFSTYVVASGLQYGMGEQVFHFFFKTSWLGQEPEIPIFGEGDNIVPTIHIKDLASVIQNVIKHQPKPYYLLAVDSSNNTMDDIVRAVASALGPGKIRRKPSEEAYLTRDMNIMDVDSLTVNLRMESIHIKELFSINWLCETGFVEDMSLVVEEYRQTRGLLPIRLCVLGPPAVGKSIVSKLICEHYKLHHITQETAISETITKLEDTLKNSDVEGDDAAAEAMELLNSLKESMLLNDGLLDEQLLVKVVKTKLTSNPCRNQGFVLDGLPSTYEQAKLLFSASDDNEGDEGMSQTSQQRFAPEFVLCLDASDTFLKERVMNLPERLVQQHGYEQEHFLQQLARYRENNIDDDTVINYFDELDVTRLNLEITSNEEPDHVLLMQKIFDTMGKPRNYGPDSEESKMDMRKKAEEKMDKECRGRWAEQMREVDEARLRVERWHEWMEGMERVRQQEEQLLEGQSVPMKNYLQEHVMPILTQGLIQCCTARPSDPIDFLAEFLFKNNPCDY